MKFCPVVPEICRGQVHGAQKERRIIITRYDYNLTIMKSPKPATDTIYPHIKILMISDNVEFLPTIFMSCFGSHFENGRHLENFENAELLL
jgi:hypothetical protein